MKEFIEKLIGRLEKEEEYQLKKAGECEQKQAFEMISASKSRRKNAQCFDAAIQVVKQLAEEYNNGWISANDRLPEENGKYIVYYRKWTFGNYLPKFDEKEIRILRYSTNGWFFPTYGDVEAEKDIHREVIAWQPLPEPYKPKGVINGTE